MRRRLEPRAVHPQPRAATASPSSRCRRAAWSRRSSRSCAPARASGSRTAAAAADREVVDKHRPRPGAAGRSRLHAAARVADTEEEEGYYYGFSNEGLWPLCHLAYVRPAFREQRLARVPGRQREVRRRRRGGGGTGEAPVMLIQDFHFALLPQLIRERKPKATIALFWHIPWPNAETFGVCPWKRELLLAHAERRHPGLPHALSLPEFPRDRRPASWNARSITST